MTIRDNRSHRVFLPDRITYNDSGPVLCGFPSFCSGNASTICLNTTLEKCAACDMAEASILIAFYVLMGCLILAGNGMVLFNVFTKRKGFDDTYSKVRASLAIADTITGIQIFAVVVYNFSWTIQSSAFQLDLKQSELRGSTKAVVGGVFYLLGFVSSLYHMVYLSGQRLYAIVLPIHYKMCKERFTYIGLLAIWILSLVASTFPLWFPVNTTFAYYHTTFVYFPTHVSTKFIGPQADAVLALVFLLILPYILMSVLSSASGVTLYLYHRQRLRRLTASSATKSHRSIGRREVHVFKTVIIMQIGFTITLVPVAVVTSMFYAGKLTCDTFSTPYLVCFTLSVCNSLANVVIYFALDKKFRSSILDLFAKCFSVPCKPAAETCTGTTSNANNNNNNSSSQTKTSNLTKSAELKRKHIFSIAMAVKDRSCEESKRGSEGP